MIELDYNEFPDLIQSLNTRLVTDSRRTEELRTQMADAESHGILLSQYVRTLKQAVADKVAEELRALMDNPPKGIKLTVPNQKNLLEERTAEITSKLEYVQELQGLIKNRCLMGQTFLNSMNVERASSNFS